MTPPQSAIRNPQSAIPPDARRTLLVYNLLFPLLLLVLLPGYLLRMMRRGNFREKFAQRLGHYSDADRARFAQGRWWWIHSISVGETLIALKLARQLHEQAPDLQIALSVTTSTGFALARESAPDWIEVLYNPIDAPGFVRTALDLIRPEQLLLIEGEAWPNLLAESHARRIPVSLINARLSPRSECRMIAGKKWIAPIFRLLHRICVPDPADLARWQALGVAPEKIHLTGSIKFDPAITAGPSREAEFRALLTPLGITEKTPILLAGSTWHPEEKILTEIFLRLRQEFPDLFLILVPRHIERTESILRDLAQFPIRISRRTALPASSPCDALLIDTTGELRDWYALATVVFIGKSLPGISQIGGQNPAEPAALGKPILFGPHMENFTTLVQHLQLHEAAISIADATTLENEASSLLRDPAVREQRATRARTALAAHAGATGRTARLLLERV